MRVRRFYIVNVTTLSSLSSPQQSIEFLIFQLPAFSDRTCGTGRLHVYVLVIIDVSVIGFVSSNFDVSIDFRLFCDVNWQMADGR